MCIRINDDKKRDLLTKHYKPENCENLQIPKVNKGIGPHWDDEHKTMISNYKIRNTCLQGLISIVAFNGFTHEKLQIKLR